MIKRFLKFSRVLELKMLGYTDIPSRAICCILCVLGRFSLCNGAFDWDAQRNIARNIILQIWSKESSLHVFKTVWNLSCGLKFLRICIRSRMVIESIAIFSAIVVECVMNRQRRQRTVLVGMVGLVPR